VSEHGVVVAGGGPTGMVLAAELALAGVDVAVVEPRDGPELEGSRAGGLHARTVELLDQRGVAERFVAAGRPIPATQFATVPLDLAALPTRHPYMLALPQQRFEEILAGWVAELPVTVLRGRAVTGAAHDDDGVDVALSDGTSLRAGYLVGCDGGRSTVRRAAGIAFPGWDASTSYLIAEARTRQEPDGGVQLDAKGVHAIGPMEDGVRVRVVVREDEVGRTDPPTLADVSAALIGVRGTDYGLHAATWVSRFTDATRQAAEYRAGRVLLAGDAAHVHSPMGGQGLGLGVHDAVNLGWKLGQVVTGTSPATLLDTYRAERHPVAAEVLRDTMAQTALSRADDRIDALKATLVPLLSLAAPSARLAARVSGLGVRHDLGDGHPLLGRRMPDLDLDGGARRTYDLLHAARPVVLDLGGTVADAGRARLVRAAYDGPWTLPGVGTVAAPTAVLIRPDGHVAWVGTGDDAGLAAALAAWCGG
jgi:3-(3-hydroxy-phenyl)propionate hydroxylase